MGIEPAKIENTIKDHDRDADNLYSSVLRTQDDRFANISDWPYEPRYLDDLPDYPGLRLHYVDIGSVSARRTVLCLHGQKTWSYAFRHAASIFAKNGFRVIALDLYGFGRSDKPASKHVYTFEFHRKTVLNVIERLDLNNILIAGFDWGAWIGATLSMDMPDRIKRLLLGNMSLHQPTDPIWPGFNLWKAVQNAQLDPLISKSLNMQSGVHLNDAECAAYDAPFPDYRYKAGVRQFPNLVPLSNENPTAALNQAALSFLGNDWSGDCALVAGMKDPVYGINSMKRVQTQIKGAHPTIKLKTAGSLIFEHAEEFLPDVLDLLLD